VTRRAYCAVLHRDKDGNPAPCPGYPHDAQSIPRTGTTEEMKCDAAYVLWLDRLVARVTTAGVFVLLGVVLAIFYAECRKAGWVP
jgi:hypothetical protein